MSNRKRERTSLMARRRALSVLGLGTGAWLLAACSPNENPSSSVRSTTGIESPDFSPLFAGFEPADEPNGDLSRVVWPSFITQAGGDIQGLYAFQVVNGGIMRYMPCFCGCPPEDGHQNNRDCYIKRVNSDGSVVFDSMAPTCEICLGVTRAVIELQAEGMPSRAIRAVIDSAYASRIELATPTPYPPE